MNVLVSLPLVAFVALLLAFVQYDDEDSMAFVKAVLTWGLAAELIVEALSPFQAVRPTTLAIFWALVIALSLAAGGWRVMRRGHLRLPRLALPSSWGLRLVAGGLILYVVTLAVIGWYAPPNTWDTLNYHMSRVAHWAQNGSIGHYATGIETQNLMPPSTSVFVLHVYVLAQSDRLANLIQWFAMIGCLVVAARIATRFGASEAGRWYTAAFVVTLPTGIMQATSVNTDYAVALWVAIAALYAVELWYGRQRREALVGLGVAVGLAAATKQTAYAYLLPLVFVLPVVVLRRGGWRTGLRWGLAGLALVVILDVGPLARNFATYGSIVGLQSRLEGQANQLLNWRMVVSNVLRNASLHAGTPDPYVNKAIALGVRWVHKEIGLDVNDPRTTVDGSFRVREPGLHETDAGNPVHALLLVLAVPLAWSVRRKVPRAMMVYAALVLLTFVFLSAEVQWRPSAARYHQAFFVLIAPCVGFTLEASPWKKVSVGAVGILFLACLPWLLGNQSRPLVSKWPGADVGSVLTAPRDELLFANAPYMRRPYREMTDLILQQGCNQVGVSLPGFGLEYPIWSLLGAPRDDLRVEWLVGGTASERYVDPNFNPCAVVCDKCPSSWDRVRGLPQVYRFGSYKLFLGTPARSPGE